MRTKKSILGAMMALGFSVAIAADAPSPAMLDSTKAALAQIKLGMTRAEVEAMLGPDWKPGIVLCWASGEQALYSNANLPGYEMEIHYDWTGQRGIGRRCKPEDPVIKLPILKPENERKPAGIGE